MVVLFSSASSETNSLQPTPHDRTIRTVARKGHSAFIRFSLNMQHTLVVSPHILTTKSAEGFGGNSTSGFSRCLSQDEALAADVCCPFCAVLPPLPPAPLARHRRRIVRRKGLVVLSCQGLVSSSSKSISPSPLATSSFAVFILCLTASSFFSSDSSFSSIKAATSSP